jgi:predicted SnoaL-like aldol condensation-catalyzing enzyme
MNTIGISMAAPALAAAIPSGTAHAELAASTLTSNPLGIAAVELLDLAFNRKRVDEAIDRYLAPPYTQHNPQVPDGIEGARGGIAGLLRQIPGWHYDFKRVLVDGDLVAVHSRVTTGPDDTGMAVVDIFRAENGRFVEHWDVIQPVPEAAANQNGMF